MVRGSRRGDDEFGARVATGIGIPVAAGAMAVGVRAPGERGGVDAVEAGEERGESVDAQEAIDALWPQCDRAVLDEIAGRQRMRATLQRVTAVR